MIRGELFVRRNARGGRSATEHLIAAMRCIYRRPVMDGLIKEADNRAAKVAKPRRLASTRRAVPDTHLTQIVQIPFAAANCASVGSPANTGSSPYHAGIRFELPPDNARGADPPLPAHVRRTVCRRCAARRSAFTFAVTW
jgi:hypothetical protein